MNLGRLILEYERLLRECDVSCERREELKRGLSGQESQQKGQVIKRSPSST